MAKQDQKKNSGNGEDTEAKKEFKDTAQKDEQQEQEEVLRQLQEEIDKLGTKDILVQMMMSVSSLAYKKMGLPQGTNDRFKDQGDAKLAVDAFSSLLKVLDDELSAEERENLNSSLSNLQLNFVKIFK
ncbi:MAG: DUF1844 domain-containing protein [Actinomycetota bacterium]|nr:DUF1844 domain-containing protein [Actinomycetota bacterium]